ncbi:hypothetical protein DL762_008848 [Monosporascus cannonballus]|uniref:Uncharacterized protein n=1 Tax=Monosporascus cannonballus TaxID=155416 RepID=A0ABY0GUZ6_9PEZI|nr:hypothetical protein DL762_008848 [Monosporascus cannonballus]
MASTSQFDVAKLFSAMDIVAVVTGGPVGQRGARLHHGTAGRGARERGQDAPAVGIRVNSIAPGYFPSEMTAKSSDDNQKGHLPLRRAGREEMGMTVLYLAKNLYVNGQIITVDGGVLNVIAGS